jgi:hypothetical protein
MASPRHGLASLTQPEAPPRPPQQRSRHHGGAVRGICADLHSLGFQEQSPEN